MKKKCPKCKSKDVIFIVGSTCLTPINKNWWGLCEDCLHEWDTKQKGE